MKDGGGGGVVSSYHANRQGERAENIGVKYDRRQDNETTRVTYDTCDMLHTAKLKQTTTEAAIEPGWLHALCGTKGGVGAINCQESHGKCRLKQKPITDGVIANGLLLYLPPASLHSSNKYPRDNERENRDKLLKKRERNFIQHQEL
ncbi:unnamed protein product [Pleuronectes platessa]|uniref:Uncharacterized protein n=1 Tax=Pleuronectes platessa TaxID=8262 RepID=A0A9N7U6P3_PLEPL|nr:unnamed protein product [Pleuronectes platessa]